MADKAWSARVTQGDGPAVAEFNLLSSQASRGDATPNLEIEVVDGISSPSAMPRAGYQTLLEGLQEGGLPDSAAAYIRGLDAGTRTDYPTAGDGKAARLALDRAMKDPAFVKDVLAGDPAANSIRTRLAAVISLAVDDGQPASQANLDQLAAWGLR
jgi:hypothetical protein